MEKTEPTVKTSIQKPFQTKKWGMILGLTFLGYVAFHFIVNDVMENELQSIMQQMDI